MLTIVMVFSLVSALSGSDYWMIAYINTKLICACSRANIIELLILTIKQIIQLFWTHLCQKSPIFWQLSHNDHQFNSCSVLT